MGHIGMLPQSTKGKYLIFGRKKEGRGSSFKGFNIVRKSWCVFCCCGMYSSASCKKIVDIAKVPIIGIGATAQCHGQILVSEDLVGLSDFEPKFLKRYANIKMHISSAFQKFSHDVKKENIHQKKLL